jgi:hypothetical protein
MSRSKSAMFGICVFLGCSGRVTPGGSPDGTSAVTCQESAGGGSAALDSSPVCNMTFDGCSDGQTYSVTCPGAPAPCTCQLNGSDGKRFADKGDACGSPQKILAAINEACGWNLQQSLP